MSNETTSTDCRYFSCKELRFYVGILGLALPILVTLGTIILFPWDLNGSIILDSISAYYYTGMSTVFTGILFVIGLFLLSYKGYDDKDKIAGDLVCIFALGTALFPTKCEGSPSTAFSVIHFVSAALFLLTLAYFSIFLFTKTAKDKEPTKRKLLRNKIYRACGYIILGCLIVAAVYFFLPETIQIWLEKSIKPIFWLEAIAIWSFGVSWFVKGEGVLRD